MCVTERFRPRWNKALNLARKTMGTNADAAIQSLKAVLDNVDRIA